MKLRLRLSHEAASLVTERVEARGLSADQAISELIIEGARNWRSTAVGASLASDPEDTPKT
jgi:hypothetical protein